MTTRKTKITRSMLETANIAQAKEIAAIKDRHASEINHWREAMTLMGEKNRKLTQDNEALRKHAEDLHNQRDEALRDLKAARTAAESLAKQNMAQQTYINPRELAAQTRIAELDKQDDTLQRLDTLLTRLEREWEAAQQDYTSKFDELYERTDLDRKVLNAMNERELETYTRIRKLEELASANKISPHREMLQEIIDKLNKLNKLLFIS